VTSDNGTVTKVIVNGVAAKATRPNFAEWEATIVLPATAQKGMVRAHAEDAAGNVEKNAHIVTAP